MDVTEENFENVLPEIIKHIQKSTFIAIDTEFTGLKTNESFKRSYFDYEEALYFKERKNLENVSICQIGVSVFKGKIDTADYFVSTYNFYIRPHSVLTSNENVLWQMSSLEFLKKSSFDFRMWAENGVPCLNTEQERQVRSHYSCILSGERGLQIPYEVTDKLEYIKTWTKTSDVGDTLEICFNNDTEVLLFYSSLVTSGLSVMPTYQSNNKKVLINLVNNVEEKTLVSEAEKVLDVTLGHLKGFVKVLESISKAKAPLVFHNGLIDIMLIHKQFCGNLPKNLREFKHNIQNLFPLIYDTKQLGFIAWLTFRERNNQTLKARIDVDETFLLGTSLLKLTSDLRRLTVVMYRPNIEHNPLTPKYDGDSTTYFHEAGYDAFCTGYCFMHLSHIYAMSFYDIGCHRFLSPRELVYSMKQWSNEIPVQRTGIKFMTLDNRSSPKLNLAWLVVESRNPFKHLSSEKVASIFSHFGNLDVIQRNKRSVLVAVPRFSIRNDIMRTFNDNQQFKIARYKALQHSVMVRSLVWTFAFLSTGISSWLIVKALKIT